MTARISPFSLGVVLALALAVPGSAIAAPHAMRLGFSDTALVRPAGPASMDLAAGVGASVVRLDANWVLIAKTRPGDETDPADRAYDFAALDAAVLAARAKGLDAFILANNAPKWAQGAGRTGLYTGGGAWKPDIAAFGRFGTALARRYSGTFTPAGASSPLPRIASFQAWNEPNIDTYLAPQWERTAKGYRTFAPAHYRGMLNAFTIAVKRVHSDNFVVTAGTSPFGGLTGDWRRRPLAFWRDVLCVKRACADPARFDAISSHPYSSSREGPLVDSFNPDDLPAAGMHRLVTLLRQAERLHRVAAPSRHRVWVTELGYESNPPDPDGISATKQASFLLQSFYALWRAGVDTLTWYEVMDQAPVPSYAATVQTGVFLRSGKPKPSAAAFSFPFVTDPKDRRAFWGLAPKAGAVRIQRRTAGGTWVLAARASATSGRAFVGRGSWSRGTKLRAVQGGRVSPAWVAG